jgi:hypothetical protein
MTVNNLLPRIPAGAPSRFTDDVRTLFGIVEGFAVKVREVRVDTTLSETGRTQKIGKILAGGVLEHLGSIETKTKKELQSLAAERDRMASSIRDASNFSLGLKQEARDWFRAKNEPDKIALLIDTDEPLLIEAVLNVPAWLLNVRQEFHDELLARIMQEKFGARLDEIAILEEACGVVMAATEVVLMQLRSETGVNQDPRTLAA